jgi:hypothetical protein
VRRQLLQMHLRALVGMHLVIVCPAYATDRLVGQTVKQV